jgi:hypothetical protein
VLSNIINCFIKPKEKKKMRRFFASILLVTVLAGPCSAEKWTFAAIADNRSAFSSYRNVLEEIREISAEQKDQLSNVDFVVAVGDITPVPKNYSTFKEVFPERLPLFFPVRGNHEKRNDVQFILTQILPGHGKGIKLRKAGEVSYFTDWKNMRIIVLDQYTGFGKSLDNPEGLLWLKNAIETATNVDHIFIAFHEPYFPENPDTDPFWSLLLRHRDKVRAVLCGHYHIYFRKYFPDNGADITYINAGNAGWTSHGDRRQTVVAITLDGGNIEFRAIQAHDGSKEFKVTDKWKSTEKH